MPAAARGQGTYVAIGFPSGALLAVVLWLHLHGTGIDTSLPAAAAFVALAALAERINVLASPRISTSLAGGFVVAAALVGGPLLGVCAGVSLELFTTGDVWRKRSAWAGANALQGFLVGVAFAHVSWAGASGALAAAMLGLLAGFALNLASMMIVAFDRGMQFGPQLRIGWRPVVLGWLLPGLPLAAFLYVYPSAEWLALAFAAGLLLAVWPANLLRLRLEASLTRERRRAHHDALTGAPNRYALAEALASEHARIKRGGHLAAICFLDLDRFREVNNTHGYQAGDLLLVSFYQRLREQLRATDTLFRWGGEEFVLLAPQIDQLELREFAERLRQLVASEPFTIDEERITVTCSVGAALLDEWRAPETVLDAASRLVRVAKEQRNTVEVEETREGVPARAGQAVFES